MVMRGALLLAATFALGGCAGRATEPVETQVAGALVVHDPAGWRYTVVLDTSLTFDQAENAVVATEMWAAVPGLSFDLQSAACTAGDAHTICVQGATNETLEKMGDGVAGSTRRDEAHDGAVVLLGQRLPYADRIAAHELGHAMGLVHAGEGTIMCATSGCAALTVEAADVAQFESTRD